MKKYKARTIVKELKTIRQESKLIVNISSQTLTEHEISLLKKGFKFCPATKSYDKVNFVKDMLNWFRNLRLREYFWSKGQENSKHDSAPQDPDRTKLNWYIKSDGYPTNNNTELEEYIHKVTNEIETMVSDCKDMNWNNINKNERDALEQLKSTKSLIIKVADKGGAIIVMNRKDYVDAVYKDLNNKKILPKTRS